MVLTSNFVWSILWFVAFVNDSTTSIKQSLVSLNWAPAHSESALECLVVCGLCACDCSQNALRILEADQSQHRINYSDNKSHFFCFLLKETFRISNN